MNDQRLQDRNGQTIQDDDGFLLPHFRTFAAVWNTFTRTYRYSWDEAVKHSPTNALSMRRDAFIMGCLQERYLQVAQLPWHLEPENARDSNQSIVASALTDILKATDRWHHFTMQLAEAIWYGRFANQVRWDAAAVNGQTRLAVTDHRPVNGDKIQFGFDGTPRVMVHAADATKLPGAADAIIVGDRGPMLELKDPRWRQRFVIHKHIPNDADYFEGEMAGSVHGVGLRSLIYWLWWLREEMLSWAVNHLKKIGVGGILIFYYEDGNDKSKTTAESAAKDAGERYAIAMPRPRGTSRDVSSAELLPFNEAGVQSLTAIISDYFERHIERLIIGQSLSSKAQATGMGSSVADLHADTKFRILKFDAENLADTLTRDLVAVAQRWNFPGLGFRVRLAFDIPQPDAKDKLDAASKLYAMKVPLRANDIRGAAGFGKPQPGDEIIGAPPELPPTSHKPSVHPETADDEDEHDEGDDAEAFEGLAPIEYAKSHWVKFDKNGRRIAWSIAAKRPKGSGWQPYAPPLRRRVDRALKHEQTFIGGGEAPKNPQPPGGRPSEKAPAVSARVYSLKEWLKFVKSLESGGVISHDDYLKTVALFEGPFNFDTTTDKTFIASVVRVYEKDGKIIFNFRDFAEYTGIPGQKIVQVAKVTTKEDGRPAGSASHVEQWDTDAVGTAKGPDLRGATDQTLDPIKTKKVKVTVDISVGVGSYGGSDKPGTSIKGIYEQYPGATEKNVEWAKGSEPKKFTITFEVDNEGNWTFKDPSIGLDEHGKIGK